VKSARLKFAERKFAMSEETHLTEVNNGDSGGGTAVATGYAGDDVVRRLGDTIAGLTSVEAHYLRRYLRDTYQIEAPETGAVVENTDNSKNEKEEKVEQTAFDLLLTGLADPTKKLSVVKEVRAMTGLSLGDAKAAVEGASAAAPKTLKEALTKDGAEKAQATLVAAGATVTLK
jgi:large subunit ribosomal protein L7/L12